MALMLRASAVVMAYEHVRHMLEERLKGSTATNLSRTGSGRSQAAGGL